MTSKTATQLEAEIQLELAVADRERVHPRVWSVFDRMLELARRSMGLGQWARACSQLAAARRMTSEYPPDPGPELRRPVIGRPRYRSPSLAADAGRGPRPRWWWKLLGAPDPRGEAD